MRTTTSPSPSSNLWRIRQREATADLPPLGRHAEYVPSGTKAGGDSTRSAGMGGGQVSCRGEESGGVWYSRREGDPAEVYPELRLGLRVRLDEPLLPLLVRDELLHARRRRGSSVRRLGSLPSLPVRLPVTQRGLEQRGSHRASLRHHRVSSPAKSSAGVRRLKSIILDASFVPTSPDKFLHDRPDHFCYADSLTRYARPRLDFSLNEIPCERAFSGLFCRSSPPRLPLARTRFPRRTSSSSRKKCARSSSRTARAATLAPRSVAICYSLVVRDCSKVAIPAPRSCPAPRKRAYWSRRSPIATTCACPRAAS